MARDGGQNGANTASIPNVIPDPIGNPVRRVGGA